MPNRMMGGGMGRGGKHATEQPRKFKKSDWNIIKRIAVYFRPYKAKVTIAVIAIIATTLLGLINPLMIKYVLDYGIAGHNLKLLLIFVSIMFVTPIITGVIGVGQTYLTNVIGQHVMRDLRDNLYQHLQRMSLRFFTSTKTGEMQSRLSNDIGGVQTVITDVGASIVSNLSTVLSTVVAMLILSPLLTVVSLALVPLFIIVTYKVGQVRRLTSAETQESLASLTALMQETLSISGILLIKTFGTQDFVQTKFSEENQKLAGLQIKQQMLGRWLFMFIGTFFSILPAVVYLVAGLEAAHSPLHPLISLGGIVAFTTLQSRLFFPIGQLLNVQVEFQGALALFERILDYLDLDIEIQDTEGSLTILPAEQRGEIVFDHVGFSYTEDRATLEDISFAVQPGQLAALVGPSGAGKTTITYLIPRLYDVTTGSISLDGHNVKDITLPSLSQMIGMVTQETFLFNASLKENLLFAKQDATDEEIQNAAMHAHIHDRIMELESGYDTIVGERGYKLSGGEKQRIAIARVMLKDPKILILDEATSALDTHSERLIQDSLGELMHQRTTIAIAHRLSTILAADVILVIDKGRIFEKGTHAELLAKGGLYAKLYKEQFEYTKASPISVNSSTNSSSKSDI